MVRGKRAGVVPAGAFASSTSRKKCHSNLLDCELFCESLADVETVAWLVIGVPAYLVKDLSLRG